MAGNNGYGKRRTPKKGSAIKGKRGGISPKPMKEILTTKRQAEIAELLGKGVPYSEIAQQLGCSIKNVHYWREKIIEMWREVILENAEEFVICSIRDLLVGKKAIMPDVELGKLGAIDMLIKIDQRIARILGTDAPTKTRIEGDPRSPLRVVHAHAVTSEVKEVIQLLPEGELERYEQVLMKELTNQSEN